MPDIVTRTAAQLSAAIYEYPQVIQWDHFDDGTLDDGICWGVQRAPGVTYVVFRGSAEFKDWVRDLDAWANPWVHSALGPVHPGFLLGMDRVLGELEHIVGNDNPHEPPLCFTGHSLGAARATILAGLVASEGALRHRLLRIVFGEPKSGFQQLADLIGGNLDRSESYVAMSAGGHDRVTDLPFSFPPEEFVHAARLIGAYIVPMTRDPWGIFAWHHMSGYLKALDVAA